MTSNDDKAPRQDVYRNRVKPSSAEADGRGCGALSQADRHQNKTGRTA